MKNKTKTKRGKFVFIFLKKNSLKRTNRYKLIKILKNIIRYDYIQTSPRECRNVKIDKVIYSSYTGTL